MCSESMNCFNELFPCSRLAFISCCFCFQYWFLFVFVDKVFLKLIKAKKRRAKNKNANKKRKEKRECYAWGWGCYLVAKDEHFLCVGAVWHCCQVAASASCCTRGLAEGKLAWTELPGLCSVLKSIGVCGLLKVPSSLCKSQAKNFTPPSPPPPSPHLWCVSVCVCNNNNNG